MRCRRVDAFPARFVSPVETGGPSGEAPVGAPPLGLCCELFETASAFEQMGMTQTIDSTVSPPVTEGGLRQGRSIACPIERTCSTAPHTNQLRDSSARVSPVGCAVDCYFSPPSCSGSWRIRSWGPRPAARRALPRYAPVSRTSRVLTTSVSFA
jgi:hypothetical protein